MCTLQGEVWLGLSSYPGEGASEAKDVYLVKKLRPEDEWVVAKEQVRQIT